MEPRVCCHFSTAAGCILTVPLWTMTSPGVPPPFTMTPTNCGVFVQVKPLTFIKFCEKTCTSNLIMSTFQLSIHISSGCPENATAAKGLSINPVTGNSIVDERDENGNSYFLNYILLLRTVHTYNFLVTQKSKYQKNCQLLPLTAQVRLCKD